MLFMCSNKPNVRTQKLRGIALLYGCHSTWQNSVCVCMCVCVTLGPSHKPTGTHMQTAPTWPLWLADVVCDNTTVCSSAKPGQSSRAWMHVWLVQLMTCHSDLPAAVFPHPSPFTEGYVWLNNEPLHHTCYTARDVCASIGSMCDICVREGASERDLRMSGKWADMFRLLWQPSPLHRTFHLWAQLIRRTKRMMEREKPRG